MNLRDLPPLIEQFLAEYNDDDTTDERRIELERLLEDAEFTISEKCDSLASWDSSLKGEEEFLASEIKRLSERKSAIGNRRERLRRFIQFLLRGEKLKTALHSFYYMQRSSVIVSDMDELSESFKRITIEPKRDEIGKALKAGEAVAGAYLEEGHPSLVIR